MKRISFVLFFVSFSLSGIYAQVIENKLNVLFLSGFNDVYGNTVFNESNYITPSLYANYTTGYSYKLKFDYKISTFIDLSLKLNNVRFNNWQYYTDDIYFKESKSNLFLILPTIQIHNKFNEAGFLNRVKGYIEVSPLFGKSKLTLDNPVFNTYSESGVELAPLIETSDFIWGMEFGTGISISISNSFGISSNFSYTYNKVNSAFYNDKHISYTSLNFGIFVRLFKNKHYYY